MSYVPNRLFQEFRPTDDVLYRDLKEYNREMKWNFLEYFVKTHRDDKTLKIETKNLWMAFEEYLDNVGEKRRMEGITSRKFHFSFKQKICQIIKNTETYENTICYSTKEKELL
jgi:hypothetical protein